jgi:hypothetical protein
MPASYRQIKLNMQRNVNVFPVRTRLRVTHIRARGYKLGIIGVIC